MTEKKEITLRDNATQHLIEFQYDRSQQILFVTFFDDQERAYKKSLHSIDNEHIIDHIEKVVQHLDLMNGNQDSHDAEEVDEDKSGDQ